MMKVSRKFFALASLAVGISVAGAADVRFNLAYYTQNPFGSNVVVIAPTTNAPLAIGTNIIVREPQTYTNDASGMLIVSNMAGVLDYWVDVMGTNTFSPITRFRILVPNTNALIDATTIIVSGGTNAGGSVTYSAASSDKRFVLANNGGATNLSAWATLAAERIAATNFVGNAAGLTNLPTWQVGRAILKGTPYATIKAARDAAIDGDTVFVNPGVYQENDLLKAGCTNFSYVFWPGAWNRFTNAPYGADKGLGVFDDRGCGATTNNIYGALDTYYSTGTALSQGNNGNTNAIGFLVTTNPSTQIQFQAHNIEMESFPTAVPSINGVTATPAVFYISRASQVSASVHDILFSRLNDTVNGAQDNVGGVWWELGETYIHFNHLNQVPASCYSVWTEEPSGLHTNNLWVTGDVMEGRIYNVGHSANYKTWYVFKDLENANGGTVGLYGGKVYIESEKIGCTQVNGLVIDSESGGLTATNQYWINAQKLSAPSGGTWVLNDGARLRVTCEEYECPSGVLSAAGGFRFNTLSGLPTISSIEGGEVSGSGIGINQLAACYTLFKGVGLSMTNSDNAAYYPAQVAAGGLILQNCRLIAPASTTESIHAGTAQSVAVYGTSANVNKGANVTLAPNGGFTVDVNVK